MANPFQGDDIDPFSAVRDEQTGEVKQTGLPPSAKTSRFGAAFAAARRAGDKTFMFNGKKYTTDLAKPKAAGMRTAAQEAADDAKIFGANAADEGVTGSGVAREARGRGSVGDRPRGGMKKGGTVKSVSKRADGCAQRGKTRGKMI